jgi:hypothetical protein
MSNYAIWKFSGKTRLFSQINSRGKQDSSRILKIPEEIKKINLQKHWIKGFNKIIHFLPFNSRILKIFFCRKLHLN